MSDNNGMPEELIKKLSNRAFPAEVQDLNIFTLPGYGVELRLTTTAGDELCCRLRPHTLQTLQLYCETAIAQLFGGGPMIG